MKLSPGLISEAAALDRVSDEVMERIETYCTTLLSANRRINLISRAGAQPVEVIRQLLISIAPLSVVPQHEHLWWLDIGSGGGFPAIPMAIFRPNISFVLAESMSKKAFFLERVVEEIQLANVTIANCRVHSEQTDLHPESGEFDWLSVKAVGDWKETLDWGRAFLKPGGYLLTYKAGRPTTAEMRAIKDVGFELHHTFDLSDFFDFTMIKVLILKQIHSTL